MASKSVTSRNILIPNARLNWGRLFVPEGVTLADGTVTAPAFSAEFIFPLDAMGTDEAGQPAKLVDVFGKELVAVATQQWREHAMSTLAMLRKEGRICLSTDPKLDRNGVPAEAYIGQARITTRSRVRPAVFDADGTPLLNDTGRLYDGCYVHAIVSLWVQDHPKGGRRVNANVVGVRFAKDGDAFSGGQTIGADAFGPLAVGGNPFASVAPMGGGFAAPAAPAAAPASFF